MVPSTNTADTIDKSQQNVMNFEKPSEIKKKKLFAAKKRQNKKNRKFR